MYLECGQSFRDTGGESASQRHSYVAPRILRSVQASLISVLCPFRHHLVCLPFFRFKCTEELSFSPVSAPADLSPLCNFSVLKQHSILFPSPLILLPYVVHLPSL